MTCDPPRHHRLSIRLPAYDYTWAGAYFITVVTDQRQCFLSEIADSRVSLTDYGEVIEQEWLRSTRIRREIQLDAFVVMPNHIHGIVIVGDSPGVGAHGRAPLPLHRPPRSLGSFVAGFKSSVTRRINDMRRAPGLPVWQRNYYEHVIRGEEELNATRQYIRDNPGKWLEDPEKPVERVEEREAATEGP